MSAGLGERGPIDTVVCDIDGVLLLGSHPIPGAGETLHRLQDAGLSLVFVSNNSTRSPAMIAERLAEVIGFDPGPDAVVNSGAATARFIKDKVHSVFVLGSDGLRATLQAAGIELTADWREADAVVTGLDFNVGYEAFGRAGLAVQNGATFYATNLDAAYPRPDGLYPGAGALTSVIETTTGVAPIVCGKPHGPMRAMLEDLGGANPLIVGDRPDTDIALGKAEGWVTALVLTGVISNPSQVPADLTPDIVMESIADLPAVLGL
jgi:HAD superfamily hydrolase (TIGR01450 family)